MFKINILSSDYSFVELIDINDNTQKIIIENKPDILRGIFNDDIVKYDGTNIELVEKSNHNEIVGELQIYGTYIINNNKNTTFYVFQPLSKKYPKFSVGFAHKTKYKSNLMVTINDLKWNKKDKFPSANILHIIGECIFVETLLEALLRENKLYAKNHKIDKLKFIEYTNFLIQDTNRKRIQLPIYSIDPIGCIDIDDAFSIYEDENEFKLLIHISDVYVNLSLCLKPTELTNYTSIYFPNKVYHMLPTFLSTNMLSLLEDSTRLMITLELSYNKNKKTFSFNAYKSTGEITKNYDYDSVLNKFSKYYDYIEKIYYNYTNKHFKITDSHNLIECFMILYNFMFGEHILRNKPGTLYRVQDNSEINNLNIMYSGDEELDSFLKLINSESAIYSYDKNYHSSLDMFNYLHMTSPIRRFADIVNQSVFYESPINVDIEKVNGNIKLVKKITRQANKLWLAYRVNSTQSYYTVCYIYDVDIDNNYMYLYFPNEKIAININIVDNKIFDKSEIYFEEGMLIIKNDINNKRLKMNSGLSVQLFGSLKIRNIDNSLMVEFN